MKSGKLLIGFAPLGYSADISLHLIKALSTVDIIAAEDTRRLQNLIKLCGIQLSGKLVSFFSQNEKNRTLYLIKAIESGSNVLIISDSGLPILNDPGYYLIKSCIKYNIQIICLPGPSAITTALIISGLPVNRFCFEGFAPRKQADRVNWFKKLSFETRTIVFFESPRRLNRTLNDATHILSPYRRVVICREMTKIYEEVNRGSLGDLVLWSNKDILGEITIVISGKTNFV